MDAHKNKIYPLRINNKLMEKIKIIADKDGKSVNKIISFILEEYILKYEYKNGAIEINQDNYSNNRGD